MRLSDQEKNRRKSVFLEKFKELRKRKPALRAARMKYEQWVRFMKSDSFFANEVGKIERYLDSTIRCSKCGYVGGPDEFINLNKTLTRSGRCKPCHSKRQVKRVQNNLSSKFVKLIADARIRDSSANQLNVAILRKIYSDQKGKCFYTGIDLSHSVKDGMILVKEKRFSPMISMDRYDPIKGYDPENVVLCCLSINLMKGGLSPSSFLEMCERVLAHAQEKSR